MIFGTADEMEASGENDEKTRGGVNSTRNGQATNQIAFLVNSAWADEASILAYIQPWKRGGGGQDERACRPK